MWILRAICSLFVLVLAIDLGAQHAAALQPADAIPESVIATLETKLTEAGESSSSARKKLAIKRVIRECESLIEENENAANRFVVLGVLFRAQQALLGVDGSATNRRAFLETCRELAKAPNEYAAIRLDADLLLSQAELAKQGADLNSRGDALRPLLERYKDTEVEAKLIRIAMLMALEFGDNRLVGHLRGVIAERFAGDIDMINFQRDKLGGQVFGAPLVGRFERSDGKPMCFPMDSFGTTTGFFFWSNDNDGDEDLRQLAEAWNSMKDDAAGRYRFVSVNLDDLPDAGASQLRELGLDWPALRLPGGRENPLYKAYARFDPRPVTVSPAGYAALFLSGGRPSRGYERNMQSALARQWTKPRYNSQLQSILAGEFFVLDSQGEFDPAAPPEWKALHRSGDGESATGDNLVPEETLKAIQACFTKPPFRYRLPANQVLSNYTKADKLCGDAIAKYADAPNLWVVRNRRIVARLGLWKMTGDVDHFEAAAVEAKQAIEAGYPAGTGVVARFCLARASLREADAEPAKILADLVGSVDENAKGQANAAAALLALEIGDRRLHEQYRRSMLDEHADDPSLWTATAFMLDRYHRYWLYHPPFTAGWTYGRRQGHFLAIGESEDAERTFQAEFKTLEGETITLPSKANGKWTVISFSGSAKANAMPRGTVDYAAARPLEDVQLFSAVLDDDAEAARAVLAEAKRPDNVPVLLVPGGMKNPMVQQLGILKEDERTNYIVIRPDGSVATMLSGLTMSSQHGNAIQNVLESHDEQAVDAALAAGNIAEAKRLAFAYAPVEEPTPPDQKQPKPKTISNPHLRARAKVYMAMKNWEAALVDAQAAYLSVNSKAGWLSMRTDDLEETESLRDTISAALEQSKSAQN